jgi:DMSO/TMAO reductase YedYZ molybdopterin-dependent catalytic subunit
VTDVAVETPPESLTTYITPSDAFFVRHHSPAQAPDPDDWALVVDGEVLRPLRLSLAELKQLPSTTVTCVLECAGNGRSFYEPSVPGLSWGRGAVGNARLTGVRVRELLEKAGLKAGAKHLHTAGADDPPPGEPRFLRSVEIEKAIADAIVAYEMNGEDLPPLHGAPARLVVPGWAGDHWMKWLARLSPGAEEAAGFFMESDYRYPVRPGAPGVAIAPREMRPITDLFVKSLITRAPARARVGIEETIRGVAWSGAPDVAGVDLSDDDGATWAAADLDPEHDPYAWRLWSFPWTPRRAGRARLRARATDSRGSVQPRDAVWNPGGFLHNGWDSVELDVSR